MKIYITNKPVGETPLQALEALRKRNKISQSAKLTYAGRLDPMAEGVLIILEGASEIQKQKILALPKIYQAEVLFGFSSDTLDVLGIAKKHSPKTITEEMVFKFLKQYIGMTTLPLPAYSSPPIAGKSLFVWARQHKLKKRDIPNREMKITRMQPLGSHHYQGKTLLKKILTKIAKVDGDFRQKLILKNWQQLLKSSSQSYLSVSFTVHCASGTYIRSLSSDLGKKLGTGTILLSLKRLSVGKYTAKK